MYVFINNTFSNILKIIHGGAVFCFRGRIETRGCLKFYQLRLSIAFIYFELKLFFSWFL